MRLHSGNFTPTDQRLSSNQVVDDERPVEGGKRGGGEESIQSYNVFSVPDLKHQNAKTDRLKDTN